MNFLSSFQPSIVHLSTDMCIPKSLQGKYMLCLNALGIKWFEENFISLEIGGLIEGESLGPNHIMLEDSGSNKIDVPRIYVVINESLVKDDSLLSNFFIQGLTNNLIYADGIEGFRPGIDYYVNETFNKWLTRKEDHNSISIAPISTENDDIVLPDYIVYDRKTDIYNISDYFEELTDVEKNTNNLNFFLNKNKIQDLKFSTDELDNLPQIFFKIILEYNMIDKDRKNIYPNNGYFAVMKYYANFKSDEATTLLQTIFNQDIVDASEVGQTITYKCNTCNNTQTTIFGDSSIDNKSCYEKYKDAMDIWLSSMLSDIDYYNDWFMEKEGTIKYANYDMIDLLIDLLKSAIEYNHFPEEITKKPYNCNCPSLDSSYNDNDCNINILKNYIKVLEWTKKCELVQNTNKIKVYGKDFAEFLKKY